MSVPVLSVLRELDRTPEEEPFAGLPSRLLDWQGKKATPFAISLVVADYSCPIGACNIDQIVLLGMWCIARFQCVASAKKTRPTLMRQ